MTQKELRNQKRRGSTLPMCFKSLLKATLQGDLGLAQEWHQFIYISYPKKSIEVAFEEMFKDV